MGLIEFIGVDLILMYVTCGVLWFVVKD